MSEASSLNSELKTGGLSLRYTIMFFSTVIVLLTPVIIIASGKSLDSWSSFLLVLISGLLANGVVLYVLIKNLKELFIHQFYIIFTVFSLFWLILYHILADDTDIPYGGYNVPYDRDNLKHYLLWLIPPIVTICMYPALAYWNGRIRKVKAKAEIETTSSKKAVVMIFFLFNVVFLLGNVNAEIPVISYMGRVGHNTSILFLFWIGFWNRRLGMLFYLTIGLIAIISVMEILGGSRYGAVMSGVLLFLGLYMDARPPMRFKMRLFALILFPFVVIGAGYLDKVRQLIGREGLQDVSLERIEEISSALDKIDNLNKGFGIKKESAFVDGVARNVNWVNMAVVTMSGEKVDFRGWRNLDTEFNNILQLTFLSSGGSTLAVIEKARLDKYEQGLSTAPARRYGFSVNERTSVEWGLLSDGYSRGGPWVYAIYLVFFLLMMNMIEFVIKNSPKNLAQQKLLLSVFILVILKANGQPFYELIREVILNGTFYLGILLILRFIPKRIK